MVTKQRHHGRDVMIDADPDRPVPEHCGPHNDVLGLTCSCVKFLPRINGPLQSILATADRRIAIQPTKLSRGDRRSGHRSYRSVPPVMKNLQRFIVIRKNVAVAVRVIGPLEISVAGQTGKNQVAPRRFFTRNKRFWFHMLNIQIPSASLAVGAERPVRIKEIVPVGLVGFIAAATWPTKKRPHSFLSNPDAFRSALRSPMNAGSLSYRTSYSSSFCLAAMTSSDFLRSVVLRSVKYSSAASTCSLK